MRAFAMRRSMFSLRRLISASIFYFYCRHRSIWQSIPFRLSRSFSSLSLINSPYSLYFAEEICYFSAMHLSTNDFRAISSSSKKRLRSLQRSFSSLSRLNSSRSLSWFIFERVSCSSCNLSCVLSRLMSSSRSSLLFLILMAYAFLFLSSCSQASATFALAKCMFHSSRVLCSLRQAMVSRCVCLASILMLTILMGVCGCSTGAQSRSGSRQSNFQRQRRYYCACWGCCGWRRMRLIGWVLSQPYFLAGVQQYSSFLVASRVVLGRVWRVAYWVGYWVQNQSNSYGMDYSINNLLGSSIIGFGGARLLIYG